MQKTKAILVLMIVIFGMAFFVSPVQAEELVNNVIAPNDKTLTEEQIQQIKEQLPSTLPESEPIKGSVNCFDYYKFGSVQVDIESEIVNAIPGVPLTLQGKIKNENNYPVVDGLVYVKVFKKQTDEDKAHANGHFLVDQFVAKDNISLKANEEQDIVFDWQIPNYATKGEYQIATFFLSQKKFNLLGLSFTDDIVGNTFNFQINSENTTTVEWDKNNVTMNDQKYNFAAFIPKFQKDETVTIKTKLQNSTKETQSVPVVWTLYSWDGQQKENIINTKEENISLNPNETKELQYQITNNNFPVYYIVAEAKHQDTKSVIGMRFGRNDVNKVRLNFPAITNYPLKANQPNTIFSCLHNSGLADQIENNKLKLTLLDENNKTIHTYNYDGPVSGAMMGLKDDFTPEKDYATFTLKAELYTDNKLVDEAEIKYDCNQIDKNICITKSENPVFKMVQDDSDNTKKTIILFAVILLSLSIVLVLVYKNRRLSMNILLLVITCGTILFGGANGVEAKSIVWSNSGSVEMYSGKGMNYQISVSYQANLWNVSNGGWLSDNNNVAVGTVIEFKNNLVNSDISWFGTGYNNDSPFGYWVNGAGNPGTHCDNEVVGYGASFPFYMDLSVNQPSIYISNSGSANISCTGLVCNVNSSGSIVASVNFSATYSKWWETMDWQGIGGKHCVFEKAINGVNIPAQAITYNLTAVATNNPPTAPIIIPLVSNNNLVNQAQSFAFQSTDPDKDTLRYGIDWDNNNTVDQWIPGSGYVSSGTSQNASHTWITTGVKTFKAQACDNKGSCSTWSTPLTINITKLPACIGTIASATLIPGDDDGLSSDTYSKLVITDTIAKCEYRCNSGWHYKSGSCEADCQQGCADTPSACSKECGGGTQTCNWKKTDCTTTSLSLSCNTQSCPVPLNLNWKEVSPN